MPPKLGLFLIKILLIFNVLAHDSLLAKSTLIRHGKQNDLINTAATIETELDSTSTEELFSISPQTSTETPLTFALETTTSTVSEEEITKTTSAQPQQQQQQQQQQPQQPWNSVWNTAQSILPIMPSNWWPTNQQNTQQISSNMQVTPVASLTLTFGKKTVNKGYGSNTNINGGGGIGIFGCPPPIVISGVCPETTCNCQCDNNNNKKNSQKMIPVVQIKTEKISEQKLITTSTTSSPSISEQTKKYQHHRQQEPIKFILPFQSWQEFFLKPVQMITSRTNGGGGNSGSITSIEGDQNNIEKIKDKQSTKIIPELRGFPFWY